MKKQITMLSTIIASSNVKLRFLVKIDLNRSFVDNQRDGENRDGIYRRKIKKSESKR